METTYWQRQGTTPLFEELEWNKPERRDQAGKLLIVGGNMHALMAPAAAYEMARKQGIGTAKIALPDKTKNLVGKTLPDAVFLPSTSSGEFSNERESELLQYAHWADSLLLAGDFGRNSQTSLLLETLLSSLNTRIVLTKDSLESLGSNPEILFNRPETTIVASFSQLQRLIKQLGEPQPLQFSMSLVQLTEYFHALTKEYPAGIITLHEQQIVVATGGNVSTTKISGTDSESFAWRLNYAGIASCYQTWYPTESFKALTHSAYKLAEQNQHVVTYL